MTRPVLASFLLLLLSVSAVADDFYVPFGGATELQIANASAYRTDVTIEMLGGKTVRVALDAGQAVRWADVMKELFGERVDGGALRIAGDAALQVKAATSASVPVLSARHATDEGELPARGSAGDPAWRSAIVAVNPDAAPVVLTLAEESLVIPGGGMLRVPRDSGERLPFSATAPLLLLTYDTNEQSGARVFSAIQPQPTRRKRRAMRSGSAPPPPPPPPQTVVLTPSKDNTLFQSFNGASSNGAGVHLFAGATGGGSLRRALLAFNVAAQIPPGSRILSATLRLNVSKTIAGGEPATLHRVTADWGEGTSNAGSLSDGNGASARTGDATWVHTFSPDRRWTSAGGDFAAAADATATVGSTAATWPSSASMIARVQEWLDQPAANFGWIILGNEQESTTAKRFDSREISSESSRPSLTIEFQR